jgi:hypothetical protein
MNTAIKNVGSKAVEFGILMILANISSSYLLNVGINRPNIKLPKLNRLGSAFWIGCKILHSKVIEKLR